MGLNYINKGSAANDKTGTPARQAADIINGNFDYLDNRIVSLENPDGVLKSGEIDTDVLNVDVAADAFEWQIDQVKFLDNPAFHAVLDAATDGYYRKDVLLGNNTGGYNIFKGDEDPTSATEPSLFPVGTIKLGVIDVYGAVITGSISVDVSGKEDKANKNQPNGYAGLDGNGEVLTSSLGTTVKAFLKTYFDTIYVSLTGTHTISGLKTFLHASLGLRNMANTVTSYFSNSNTSQRTYFLQDRSGTLLDDTDLSAINTSISSRQVKDDQIEISVNNNVQNSWHGQTVLFTSSCTITVPASLNNSLMFAFRTLAGVTVTWAITSPFTWETTPVATAEKTVGHFMRRGSTNTIFLDV